MPISPIVATIPVPQAVAQPLAQSQNATMASMLQQVVQEETGGGRGGGGGGHARKPGLDAIAQIAAGTVAKPKPRVKTLAERQAEIERMKREQNGNPQRDPAGEREETPQERARRNPLLALF